MPGVFHVIWEKRTYYSTKDITEVLGLSQNAKRFQFLDDIIAHIGIYCFGGKPMRDNCGRSFVACEKQEMVGFKCLVVTFGETLTERSSVDMIGVDSYRIAHNYCSFSARHLLFQVFTYVIGLEKSLLLTSISYIWKYLNGSVENSEIHARKEITFMMGPYGNQLYEIQRIEEDLAEKRGLTDDKPSRVQALVILAIVLFVLAGIILFVILR